MKHILFFLGSGVSFPSGMPGVEQLTEKIFTKPMVPSHGTYVERKPTPPIKADDIKKVNRLRNFLHWLKCRMEKYLFKMESRKSVNYEDLMYLCDRLRRVPQGDEFLAQKLFSHIVELDNIEKVDYVKLLRGEEVNGSSRFSGLKHTATEAMKLIRNVVDSELDKEERNVEGLGLIKDVIQDPEVGRVTIVTLCHDRLVERMLSGEGPDEWSHEFCDGFGEPTQNVQEYLPGSIHQRECRVKLIKPHGSVDWKLAEKKILPNKRKTNIYAKYKNQNKRYSPGSPEKVGVSYRFIGAGSTFLMRYGKEQSYGADIFGDMVYAMNSGLEDADLILVSGFGWKDRGMSHRLLNALEWNRGRRMVLLYKRDKLRSDVLCNRASYLLRAGEQYRRLRRRDQIITEVDSFLSDTDWEEVKQAVGWSDQ